MGRVRRTEAAVCYLFVVSPRTRCFFGLFEVVLFSCSVTTKDKLRVPDDAVGDAGPAGVAVTSCRNQRSRPRHSGRRPQSTYLVTTLGEGVVVGRSSFLVQEHVCVQHKED